VRSLFVLLSFLYTCFFSYAQTGISLEAELQGVIDKYQAVGLSVAVVKDNKIVYTRSFGYNPNYNDTTLRLAIPSNGIYVIQSISKSFISTAIMQLVENDKISLDDDVNKYLDFNLRNPKYPDVPITVRMLLSHRSTINDKHYGWNLDQINPEKGNKWKECYNDYKPGTSFSYCNLNYNLLGAIIEQVTGERFYDFIDEHIIKPMGLYASFNLTKIDSTRLVRAYEYDRTSKKQKKDPYIYNYQFYKEKSEDYQLGSSSTACFSPSGGMKISTTDLAKYMIMHMNYGEYNGVRIISRESEIEMRKPQGDDESPDSYFSQYGLSFSRWDRIVEGESFVGITGGAHGIHSAMYFNPDKKYGFVVICNGCTADIKMKDSIVKVLYNHIIKEE
jgi:CubicO group peptidase (beta-lactamase class C family)